MQDYIHLLQANYGHHYLPYVKVSPAYGKELRKLALSATHLAVLHQDSSTGQWQVVLVSLDKIQPLAATTQDKSWYQATAKQMGSEPALSLRLHLPSFRPMWRIEVSTDLANWAPLGSELLEETLLDADVDGDGMTALWQVDLKSMRDGQVLYYRF